jgi:hypothetical protein
MLAARHLERPKRPVSGRKFVWDAPIDRFTEDQRANGSGRAEDDSIIAADDSFVLLD